MNSVLIISNEPIKEENPTSEHIIGIFFIEGDALQLDAFHANPEVTGIYFYHQNDLDTETFKTLLEGWKRSSVVPE